MTNSAILDDLARASAGTGDLIDRIAAGQWTAPTPCTEWNVRDLVNHLVGMNLVFVAMFEDSPMPERKADRLGRDPAGAYRRSAAALQAAAARPGVLERRQATSAGVAAGAGRLQWRIADLLAHGWDLAQATGVAAGLRRRSRRAGAHVRPGPAARPAPRRTIRRSAAGRRERTRHRPAGGLHRPQSVGAMNAHIRSRRPPSRSTRLPRGLH